MNPNAGIYITNATSTLFHIPNDATHATTATYATTATAATHSTTAPHC